MTTPTDHQRCDCDRWDEATQSVVPEDRPHACRYQDSTGKEDDEDPD